MVKELNYLLIKHIFPNFESFKLAVIGDVPLTGNEEKIYDTICLMFAYNNIAYATGQELIDNMKLDWPEKFATYTDIVSNYDYKTINQNDVTSENIKKGFATIQVDDNGNDNTQHNQKLTDSNITKENSSAMVKSQKHSINKIAVNNLFSEYFSLDIRDFPYWEEETNE